MSIKSGSDQRANSKDDLSKANKLLEFYNKHEEAHIFIATFEIEFHDDMHISLANCYIMPLAWIPDVYVTPSNNGNMQSSKYKNLEAAIKRTTKEFIVELKKANQIGGYFMVDSSTWIAAKKEMKNLKVLFRGDPMLVNVYHAMRRSDISEQSYAVKFIDFLASEEGQKIIREYGTKNYCKPLYHDAAYAGQYDR
mgnify:CR=1 FL=1